ncbi:50S ribosomal protein L21 [Candidatus Kaiserbacteria bacterium]|nr:50S ribosomal protein L21 [Candidatus Kaiserbacteria bacterium]
MAKIAIIETGGKQYVVRDGMQLMVEKLPASKEGKISFDTVLLVDDGSSVKIGAPHVSGAKVTAEVVAEGRDKKVTVIHYRQKSRYFKKRGHRQPFTKVKITKLP